MTVKTRIQKFGKATSNGKGKHMDYNEEHVISPCSSNGRQQALFSVRTYRGACRTREVEDYHGS